MSAHSCMCTWVCMHICAWVGETWGAEGHCVDVRRSGRGVWREVWLWRNRMKIVIIILMYNLTIIHGSLRKVQQFFRLSRQMLIKMLNLHLVPEHNNLSHISQDDMKQSDDRPWNKVWQQKNYYCRRYSRNSYSLIIWASTVTLILKTANQFFCMTTGIQLIMMHHHTMFGFKGSSDCIVWTKPGQMATQTQGFKYTPPPFPHGEYKYVHKWCPVTACHIPPLIPHNRCPVYLNYWPVQKHWPPCLFFHICGSWMFLCTNTNSSI